MSPKAPGLTEIQEAFEKIKAEVERRLEAIRAGLPTGLQPTAAQVAAVINEVMADGLNLNSVVDALKADLKALLATGRGKATSNTSALV